MSYKLTMPQKNYVNDLTASLSSSPKKFWSFVKERTGISTVASCIEYEGKRAHSPPAKADLFNVFFQSVFLRNVSDSVNINEYQ